MTRPRLVCGPHNVQTQHPSDWDIPVNQGGVSTVSLNGSLLKDIPWRKYQYVLTFEAMDKADFEDLEDLVNYANDFGVAISFVYDRWRNTTTPVIVSADLMARAFAAGCYQKVTLTLTEMNPQAMVS